MLEIDTARNPALSVLYLIFSLAILALCMSHYVYGHYDALLTSLTAVPVFAFASIFLYLNREERFRDYVNLAVVLVVAVLAQYQFQFNPEMSFHWIYGLPLLSYFVLPLWWAFVVNSSVMLATLLQSLEYLELFTALRMLLVYMLLCACSWCYAYLNKQKHKNLMEIAVRDYQSGAYNSRQLLKVLEQEMARSQVTRRTLSIIAITIEDYTQILDIHGNSLTQQVLKGFRQELVDLIRAGDEVFHNGSGTFFLLLPNCPVDGAVVLKERLQKELIKIQWEGVGELQLNTGIATLEEGESAESFLKRASHHVEQQQKTALRLMAFS